MTNRMIENRVKKIRELEQQKKQLESEIETIKSEIKADLEEKGVEVIKTDKGIIVRWQTISSERFDSKKFQTENPDVYDLYIKTSVSHRFSYDVIA